MKKTTAYYWTGIFGIAMYLLVLLEIPLQPYICTHPFLRDRSAELL
jgi:hypothetical protein